MNRSTSSISSRPIPRGGVNITRINNMATFPEKINTSGPVYDVIVSGRSDNRTDDILSDINTFNTGLVIDPEPGFIVLITSHPDLYRSGYIMFSNIIVEPKNTKELIIPLFKYKESDIEVPFVAARMVIVPTQDVFMRSVNLSERRHRITQTVPTFIPSMESRSQNFSSTMVSSLSEDTDFIY